jgi:hypothetical protein
MANQVPTFITGANAKIAVDGVTFAYASDVSYQVVVDTIPIETMGRYEAVTNEPVNYSVAGDLSVVRYTSIANKTAETAGSKGNGLGSITGANTQTNMSFQIDPGNMLTSSSWDLVVYQKYASGAGLTGTSAIASGTTDAAAIASGVSQLGVIKISDCRFNRKAAGINKRGILVDRLSFVGILASDESFAASPSGDKDLSIG